MGTGKNKPGFIFSLGWQLHFMCSRWILGTGYKCVYREREADHAQYSFKGGKQKRNNARQPESDDFRDIQDVVIQYRKLYERYEQAMPLLKDMENFSNDAARKNPDTIPETLEEIMQYVTDISHIQT
jgi:FMN phosphatase YigB (HAD superfamily)